MLRAFGLGILEFRQSITTGFYDNRAVAYDWGREWAHRLTLRHYED
jgi:hypothetical protein